MTEHKKYLRNLLVQRFNWIEERVFKTARVHGYDQITPAMSRLFGNMVGGPAGLSDLSRRMGISRQAVHKLASEAAKLGLVRLVPSPDDARVVLVQFTDEGWKMSASATMAFEKLEAQLAKQLGKKNLAELKRLLELPWDAPDEAARPKARARRSTPPSRASRESSAP
jgi:DNA-binding MarR family transcriptional regulator